MKSSANDFLEKIHENQSYESTTIIRKFAMGFNPKKILCICFESNVEKKKIAMPCLLQSYGIMIVLYDNSIHLI
jgi:hypothetical protein